MADIGVVVRGGIAFFDPLPDELKGPIQDETSFKPAGVEYTTLVKNRKHDGRIKLLKNSKCPVGLLPRIERVVAEHGSRLVINRSDEFSPKVKIETRVEGIQDRFYQDDAVAVSEFTDWGVVRAPTGCLAGETLIPINRGGRCKMVRIDEAFHRFHGLECPNPGGLKRSNALRGWDRSKQTRCRAMVDDELRQIGVLDIKDSGIRPTVRVILKSGRELRCTPDHLIATPTGWCAAGDLSPHSVVVCNGRFYDKDGYVWVTVPNTWKDHPRVHHDGKGGYTIREHQLVMEQKIGRALRLGEIPHHKNEIKDDNRPENLELLADSAEHGRMHADRRHFHGAVHPRNGAHIQIFTHEDTVVSVDPAEECRTYDLEMERPHSNFVANGIVVHNSGKSAIGTRIIHSKGLQSVIIVPTIDLLYQFKAFLSEHLVVWKGLKLIRGCPALAAEPIGQLGDGIIDPRGVTVTTIRTMAKVIGIAYESYEYGEYDDRDDTEIDRRQLREWVDGIGLVIADECHILAAKMVYGVMNAIPAPYKIGMSASPWRDDGADLMIEAAVGEQMYRIETHTLVEHGYLVPLVVKVEPTKDWWKSAAWGKVCKRCNRQWVKPPMKRMGERWKMQCDCGCDQFKSQFTECYKAEIVENPIRNAKIAEITKSMGCPTFVLVKQVKHGQAIQSLIPGSRFLSGKEKGNERAIAFQEMRDGELQVIVATTIADMGMDIPNLGAIVLAGGGKSSTRHLQRIGRVVRPTPGKTTGVVIDFDDSHIASWFGKHEKERRKIEYAEWANDAVWI